MTIKFKLVLLATIGVIGSVLIANQAVASNSVKNRGLYLQGLVGYNRYALKDVANPKDDWTNGTGNFTVGAAFGYQFCQYFALETAGLYTLDGKAKNPSSVDPTKYEIIRTRYAYLAGRLSVITYARTTIFTKLGLGYQRMSVSNGPFGQERFRKWGAMFGAGTSYYFTPKVFIDLQWLRFTGKIVDGATHTTAPNIFLLGLGYKF
jgi:opacity protein-like surface antigen